MKTLNPNTRLAIACLQTSWSQVRALLRPALSGDTSPDDLLVVLVESGAFSYMFPAFERMIRSKAHRANNDLFVMVARRQPIAQLMSQLPRIGPGVFSDIQRTHRGYIALLAFISTGINISDFSPHTLSLDAFPSVVPLEGSPGAMRAAMPSETAATNHDVSN